MHRERRPDGQRVLDVPVWLPDDDEAKVAGSMLHQGVTFGLMEHLRLIAAERGATWDAASQLNLLSLLRPDETPHVPLPDFLVTRHKIGLTQPSLDIAVHEMPLWT